MSSVTIGPSLARRAAAVAPTTPPAGPERIVRTGSAAAGEHPLRDAEPPRARHQGRRPARLEGVERGPYLPADLDDVLETRRRHEDDARSAPLEQRVGRNRGPVVQGGGPRGERQGSEAVADRSSG